MKKCKHCGSRYEDKKHDMPKPGDVFDDSSAINMTLTVKHIESDLQRYYIIFKGYADHLGKNDSYLFCYDQTINNFWFKYHRKETTKPNT